MNPKKRKTTDAVEIMKQRYVNGDPKKAALIEQQVADYIIGDAIYRLREQLRLSRKSFAEKVGISAYAVCQLEEGWYKGSADEMFKRIKAVFRPIKEQSRVG